MNQKEKKRGKYGKAEIAICNIMINEKKEQKIILENYVRKKNRKT